MPSLPKRLTGHAWEIKNWCVTCKPFSLKQMSGFEKLSIVSWPEALYWNFGHTYKFPQHTTSVRLQNCFRDGLSSRSQDILTDMQKLSHLLLASTCWFCSCASELCSVSHWIWWRRPHNLRYLCGLSLFFRRCSVIPLPKRYLAVPGGDVATRVWWSPSPNFLPHSSRRLGKWSTGFLWFLEKSRVCARVWVQPATAWNVGLPSSAASSASEWSGWRPLHHQRDWVSVGWILLPCLTFLPAISLQFAVKLTSHSVISFFINRFWSCSNCLVLKLPFSEKPQSSTQVLNCATLHSPEFVFINVILPQLVLVTSVTELSMNFLTFLVRYDFPHFC